MYKAAISILMLAMSGCTTPSMTLPNTQRDYIPPAPYKTAKGEPCEVTGPTIADEVSQTGLIDSAARKAYTRGCDYAGYIDSAKDFGAISDQATLGLVTGAGIGALTNSNSDFIKAFGALAGLSLGSKIYVNPKIQMSTYGKAAIASQCMGDSLSDLFIIVKTHERELSDITLLEQQAEEFAAGLEALSYNQGAQKMIIESGKLNLVADISILTKNAKIDTENKKQALRFVRSAHRLTNANLRTIHNYIIATLNAQAFDIDAATKKIAATSLPTKDLLDQIKSAADTQKIKINRNTADTEKYAIGILEKLARSETKPIPYTDFIRINNEYTACLAYLSKP
ncbi:MAG: hypothetical protein ACN6O6_16690 [Pseudomonas sp.]|uniref:hypothetical protein n=1 Tax=Pseudomonas sp. TaxID=306 RepID=UPI003D11BCBA